MKQFMIAFAILGVSLTMGFAQGLISFNAGSTAATRISTNSVYGGGATGLTAANASGSYCYALFASATQSTINGSTSPITGYGANYVFNYSGWTLVGIGLNTASAGRMQAVSQGTTSAGQGPLNADGSLTVQGVAGGQGAYFVVVGWSANIGTTLAAVEAWYGYGAISANGWIGQSAVSGSLTLGDGGPTVTPNVFGTGPGQVPGFTLGTMCFDCDSTPPTVAISSPTNGQMFTVSSITASGTATDPGWPSSGVSLVQVQANGTGGTWQTASGTTSWTASVALVSGANTIYARSEDGAGNYSTNAAVNVIYNPPRPVFGSSSVSYSYDSLNRLTNVDYGNGSVISYTYDPAGNRLAYSGAVANDTIAPSISITNPTSGYFFTTNNSIINLGGTASDNVGVTHVTWANDRGGFGTAVGTNSWTINGIALQTGDNEIFVIAYDAAGNSTYTTLTVTLVVAAPPPQLTGINLTSGGMFEFNLNGPVDGNYVVQASSNLLNWVNLETNSIPASGVRVFDFPVQENRPQMFYRALPAP